MKKTSCQAHLLRALDIIIALAAIGPAVPVVAVCAVIVRATSPGPALFAQVRVGQHEKLFTCYKLRTMAHDTIAAPSHEIGSSSVTGLGKVLRMTKLDELPQLWNVLTGTMSLVGPRPCLPLQEELIAARRKNGVFSVPPGVTGLAQVRGVDMSDPPKLAKIDAQWVNDRSLGLYLKLIVQTAIGRGQGDRIRQDISGAPK